jgi:DNA primase
VIAATGISAREAIATLAQRAGLDGARSSDRGPDWATLQRTAVAPRPTVLDGDLVSYIGDCARRLWTPAATPARKWLHARGISDEVLAANQVGYDPGPDRHINRPDTLPRRGGITYPSFTVDGDINWVQIRHGSSTSHKYSNPAGVAMPICTFPRRASAEFTSVLVTEGVADGLHAASYGLRVAAVTSAVVDATRAANAISAFAGHDPIVLALDNDDAGRGATTRLLDAFGALTDLTRVHVLTLPDGHDLIDCHRDGTAWITSATGSFFAPPAAVSTAAAPPVRQMAETTR